MIRNIKHDSFGMNFDGKFGNMKKFQNFVVYPVALGERIIAIQSEGRFGIIHFDGKMVLTSKNVKYPNSAELMSEMNLRTSLSEILTDDEMKMLKEGL